MKKPLLVFSIISLSILGNACSLNNNQAKHEIPLKQEDKENRMQGVQLTAKELLLQTINEQLVFSIADFIKLVNGEYEYNEIHRTLSLKIDDQVFKFVEGVPVVEQNGIYLPIDDVTLIVFENHPYLPITFLVSVLGQKVEVIGHKAFVYWSGNTFPTSSVFASFFEKDWTVEKMIDYLSFLKKPIAGAQVSTIPNHLPGAARPYRNGYHEGIDWYAYASGQHISTKTPVYAMAEGTVVRVDHNYVEYPSAKIRNQDLALSTKLGLSPEYILDRLRGRQVWIQYEKGVMNRFAHLNNIPADLKLGEKVTSATIIGYIGNSGTSGAVNKDGSQIHLHQDLLIYGKLFWEPFTHEEVTKIVTNVFKE